MTAPRPSPAPLPPAVAAVAHALRALPVPWAVAGGCAIDLASGRVTRQHADVDVAVFREDQAALRDALPGWRVEVVRDGVLTPWAAGERLVLPVHELHARSAPGAPGPALELLLNERDGGDWVYRRDPAVRRPLARAIVRSASGVPVLAPEIVLLYKSKAPRSADAHDLAVGGALLDDDARRWLRAALHRADPAHPWAEALASGA